MFFFKVEKYCTTYVYIPHFLYALIHQWAVSLAAVDKATISMEVKLDCQHADFNSFAYIPRKEIH